MEPHFEERLAEVVRERDPMLAFRALATLYQRTTPEGRERIRRGWPFARRWRPPDPATLTWELRGEPPPALRCRTALVYHSIEDCRVDWRDNLVALCAVHHSLLRLGFDPRTEFEHAAGLSAHGTAELLRGWVARPPGTQRLEDFGWRATEEPEGWRLVPA